MIFPGKFQPLWLDIYNKQGTRDSTFEPDTANAEIFSVYGGWNVEDLLDWILSDEMFLHGEPTYFAVGYPTDGENLLVRLAGEGSLAELLYSGLVSNKLFIGAVKEGRYIFLGSLIEINREFYGDEETREIIRPYIYQLLANLHTQNAGESSRPVRIDVENFYVITFWPYIVQTKLDLFGF